MRERASASIAALWSTPTARSASGAASSSIRPVPVPRSSRCANRLFANHRHHRRLDPFLGRVQRADAVPVGGALGEIGGGLAAARFSGHRQPRAVGDEHRVGRIEAGDQIAGQRAAGAGAAVGKPEKRPGALALALGEAGLDQQFEMARHARLRLAENGDEFADRQFRLADQREQAKPGDFARRREPRQQRPPSLAGVGASTRFSS